MDIKKFTAYVSFMVLLPIFNKCVWQPFMTLSKGQFFKSNNITNSTQNQSFSNVTNITEIDVSNTTIVEEILQDNITRLGEVWNITETPTTETKLNISKRENKVNYTKLGREKLEEAVSILNSGIWILDRRTEEGDSIFYQDLPDGHKVLRLTGVVNMPANELFFILHDGLEDYPKWNPNFLECRVLKKIDKHTDISYQVSSSAAKGWLGSRDFVTLRHWVKRDGYYISGTSSVEYDEMQHSPYTRGENGPGCWELRPMKSNPNNTEFRWLMNTRLNGWIPKTFANNAFKKFMSKYVFNLRNYCDQLKTKQIESSSS